VRLRTIDFNEEIETIARTECADVAVSVTAKKCAGVFLTDLIIHHAISADDSAPFTLLSKGLRARAANLEKQGHLEIAFRSEKVAELLCIHGGSDVYATQLACVLHVFCCHMIQCANQFRIRQIGRLRPLPSDSSDTPTDSESEPEGYECADSPMPPGSPEFGYLRIRHIVGAGSDRDLREMMRKTVEFSGLFGPGSVPQAQKQTQYHYRWPLAFVVRNLRKDWGESSSDSSDGPFGSAFTCCNSKKTGCSMT